MGQQIFSGIEFGFRWRTPDWYEYDGEAAERLALKARNAKAGKLKAQGIRSYKFSLGLQLRSMGGIGSGHPHIELYVKSYGVRW